MATCVLACSAAFAAPAPDAWTLDTALKAALSTHPEILGKRALAVAADAEKKGAEWQRFPTPTLEADGRYTQSARLDQPLWTGGRITAGIDAAGFRQDAATASTAESRRDIALRVVSAWVEAQRQQLRQGYAVEGVKDHEKLLKLIGNRVEREVSPPVDRDFAKSRLLQALNDLSVVTQSLAAARTQLGQLVGSPVGKLSTVTETVTPPVSLDLALEQAIARSPSLQRLAAEEQAAGQDIVSKRSSLMPQVSLRLQRDSGDPLYTRQDSRAMLVVSAQPGAGLSSLAGVDAAVARRESARLGRETALRDLQQQLTLDWDEFVAARLRLENARLSQGMATEVFDSYARQYTTGRKTWIDVLNAARERTSSNMAEADALAQMTAAALRLGIRMGGSILPAAE